MKGWPSAMIEWLQRRWKTLAVSVLAISFVVVVYVWVIYSWTMAKGNRALAAAMAETEALDPRWRWEQIEEDREQVPEKENSVLVLKRLNDACGKWDPASLKKPATDKLLSELIDNRLLDERRLKIIRKQLNDHEEAVAIAVSLCRFRKGRAQLDIPANPWDTKLRHVDHAKTAKEILQLDLERLLHEGKADEALLRVTATLNAGGCLRGEGLCISQIVRIALRIAAIQRLERVLAMGQPSEQMLCEIAAEIGKQESEDLLYVGARGERGLMTIMFDNLFADRLTVEEALTSTRTSRRDESTWDELMWYLYKPQLPGDHAFYLRAMNRLAQSCRLPIEDCLEAVQGAENDLRREVELAGDKKHRLSVLLIPAFVKFAEAGARDKTALRCGIVVVAAERYRLEANQWPRKLDDLCPKYLPSVPLDPFDGKPLKYAHRDDGITIYSVGGNGRDEGGTTLTATGNEAVSDIGFRLWNTENRGLPPIPK